MQRKKIVIAVGLGVCALIAVVVVVAVTTTNKKVDPGPLDGPWDNVSPCCVSVRRPSICSYHFVCIVRFNDYLFSAA